jgi:hypothetical protein
MALTATSPEIFISSVSKKIKPDSTSVVKYKTINYKSLQRTPNPFTEETPQFKSIILPQELGSYPTFDFKNTFDTLHKENYNDLQVEDEMHPNLANVFSVRS